MIISRPIHVAANGIISFLWLSNIPLCVCVCVCCVFILLFICSVMSDLLPPHWLQHAPPFCPSPSPRACSNSWPLSQWCHPAISYSVVSFSSSSIFPSIKIFSNESAFHFRWPKYWSFSISIDPSNEYSGLISFRIDWLVLLAIQGTLKSLLQHHSLKASILGTQPSLWSNSHIHTWLLEKP